MKRILLVAIMAALVGTAAYAEQKWTRVEASDLTLVGKGMDTPNPYHRIDTLIYKGFTKGENIQCRVPAGLAVLFKTDAERIGVSAVLGDLHRGAYRSYRGFDLYIMKDGHWTWAGMNDFDRDHKDPEKVSEIVKHMAPGEKECLLFLPIYAELHSCQVCVPEGSTIVPLESPFRHKIVFHGSSFTQGISMARSGMSYPVQFMRRTGLQPITLGFGGNCKMQDYFAKVIEDIDADAYIFDPFSNPNIPLIRERLMPFVERMVKAHPGKPLIFQRTIYRENENFDTAAHAEHGGRRALTDSLFKVICKKYPDVYYICPDASLHDLYESSTADGIHPNDNGYSLWEKSIEKKVLRILKKYGIR